MNECHVPAGNSLHVADDAELDGVTFVPKRRDMEGQFETWAR
jgi:hypothetical protein